MINEDTNKYLLPDDEIIKKVKDGDEIYEEILVSRHYKMVYNNVIKRLRDKELAKDLTQEIFLKVLQNLNKYSENGHFTSWLCSITQNHITDYLRKNKTRSKHEIKESVNESVSVQPPPEYELKELWDNVIQYVEKLPEDQKEVFYLYYFNNMTVEEIALKLNVPKGTVTSRLFLARKKIKKFLNVQGIKP